MPAKFALKKTKNGGFVWNLLASNGEPILTSQTYKSKSGAKNGIKSVKSCTGDDSLFDRRKAKNGSPYFVLKARNGLIIGTSEMYKTSRSMENGIKSVCKNASGAAVDDKA